MENKLETIEAQLEHKDLQNKELKARMKMYEDVHSIKQWVKFFGILSVIALVLMFFGLA